MGKYIDPYGNITFFKGDGLKGHRKIKMESPRDRYWEKKVKTAEEFEKKKKRAMKEYRKKHTK